MSIDKKETKEKNHWLMVSKKFIQKPQRVVLIEPTSTPDIQRKKVRIGYGENVEPIGLLYIASILIQNGYQVYIIRQGERNAQDIVKEIKEYQPDVAGFTCFTANFPKASELAEEIKRECDCLIVFGGIHASTSPEIAKLPFIDFVVIGEGEHTFLNLLENLPHREKWKQIKGIAYADPETGELVITPPPDRIKDLDKLPFPYRDNNILRGLYSNVLSYPPPPQQRLASMVSSRGCPHNCSFCTNRKMWQQIIVGRSPQNIVDEIEYLVLRFNCNYIFFHDQNLTFSKERIMAMCKEIINRGLASKISWYCQACISDIDDEILYYMKQAGCSEIAYGVESGSQLLLQRYHKPQTLRMTIDVFRKTFEMGIIPSALFVIGAPWETYETLQETANFAKSLPALRYRFSLLYPFKGTALREVVDKENLWISEAHKSDEFATTEMAVIKCGVDEETLNNFDRKMMEEIYPSDEYISRVKKFMEIDGKYIDSFRYFFRVLKEEGIKFRESQLKFLGGDK